MARVGKEQSIEGYYDEIAELLNTTAKRNSNGILHICGSDSVGRQVLLREEQVTLAVRVCEVITIDLAKEKEERVVIINLVGAVPRTKRGKIVIIKDATGSYLKVGPKSPAVIYRSQPSAGY